jgi:hypothetical protein
MDFVVDANVLGEVCRNNEKAVELLRKIRKHRVIFCTEILKEYEPLPNRKFCRKNSELIKEWLITIITKKQCGKKLKIDDDTNSCFQRLITQKKFKKKDIIYIKAAEISNGLLIAFEQHFVNADRCISIMGIERLTIEDALLHCND